MDSTHIQSTQTSIATMKYFKKEQNFTLVKYHLHIREDMQYEWQIVK
jgi:hypothetical protein